MTGVQTCALPICFPVTIAGTAGGRVMSLTAVTDDTVTVNVFVYIYRGTTVIPLGLVNVPLSSGNTNAARFNADVLDGVNILGFPVTIIHVIDIFL